MTKFLIQDEFGNEIATASLLEMSRCNPEIADELRDMQVGDVFYAGGGAWERSVITRVA